MRRSRWGRSLGGPARFGGVGGPGAEEATFGLASDVAANIFVVLFVAVVVGLILRPTPAPVDYDLRGALGLTERRPNDAAAAIAALHRRQGGAGVSLDLTADRLRLATGSVVRVWAWDRAGEIHAALRGLGAGAASLDVFVFHPRGYALTADALRGRRFDEFNVPSALRRCPTPERCVGGDDWSEGFLRLIGREMTAEAFRGDLAALLSARRDGEAQAPPRGAEAAAGAAVRSTSSDTLGSVAGGRIGLLLVIGVVVLLEALAIGAHRRRPRL
jgi:hypothetical protein